MQSRTQQTRSIEAKLKEGQSISSIAREIGVCRQRVQQIKKRLIRDYEPAACTTSDESESALMTLTINFTPAVHDAVVAACAVANRNSPEEPTTITEYVEECVITRVVELGLLRKSKRKR